MGGLGCSHFSGRFAVKCNSHWASTGVVLAALVLVPSGLAPAGDDADSHVKFKATAGNIDKAGLQTITIVAEVSKGWHLYANPVKNEQLDDARTVVKFVAAKKLEKVDITYPAGTKLTDKTFGDYMAYEGKTEITATVKRTEGDTSPLDVTIRYMVCNDKRCVPGTAKLQAK
jgi:DsbC/DsbD-like thiol-disulfide interchange protein